MAEITVISLNRGIAMLVSLEKEFCPGLPIPDSVADIAASVHPMRNALEHIGERAQGNTRASGEVALSIFFQPDFVDRGTLRYGQHALSFENDVPATLLGCRAAIMDTIDHRVKLGLDPVGPSDQ